jgi:uncharacterized membrane protein
MEDLSEKQGPSGGNLFPIMMVNALMWAIVIIVSLVILRDTGYFRRLFPVLAGGTCVAIVAASITWRRRKQTSRQLSDSDSEK